jgi:hypothetical protein
VPLKEPSISQKYSNNSLNNYLIFFHSIAYLIFFSGYQAFLRNWLHVHPCSEPRKLSGEEEKERQGIKVAEHS